MKFIINNFNLNQIADSGQCFRWKKISEASVLHFASLINLDYNFDNDLIYLIPAFGRFIIILQHVNEFYVSCDNNEWDTIWSSYFDIDRDYEELASRIISSKDQHLIDAFRNGYGIRILHQELFETIISFIISQNNNISRIRTSINLLCSKCNVKPIYNPVFDYCSSSDMDKRDLLVHLIYDSLNPDTPFNFPDKSLYTSSLSFPSPGDIPLHFFEDKSFGFGYRNIFLKEMVEYVLTNSSWLFELQNQSFSSAKNSLISRKGIGEKVANCICLFGLNFLDSFPIDTHVIQLLNNYYPNGIDLSLFENEKGIIQQYLFYYELCNK